MKPIEEMSLEEFIDWTVGYIMLHLAKDSLKAIMYGIFLPFLQQWLPAHGWQHKGNTK